MRDEEIAQLYETLDARALEKEDEWLDRFGAACLACGFFWLWPFLYRKVSDSYSLVWLEALFFFVAVYVCLVGGPIWMAVKNVRGEFVAGIRSDNTLTGLIPRLTAELRRMSLATLLRAFGGALRIGFALALWPTLAMLLTQWIFHDLLPEDVVSFFGWWRVTTFWPIAVGCLLVPVTLYVTLMLRESAIERVTGQPRPPVPTVSLRGRGRVAYALSVLCLPAAAMVVVWLFAWYAQWHGQPLFSVAIDWVHANMFWPMAVSAVYLALAIIVLFVIADLPEA